MKELRRKSVWLCILLLTVCFFTGCSKKKEEAPTLGKQIENYKGFEYLKAVDLTGAVGKDNKKVKQEIYIPDADNKYVKNDNAAVTTQGVNVRVEALSESYRKLCDTSTKKMIEKYGTYKRANVSYLKEEIDNMKMINDEKDAYQKGIVVSQNYSGKYETTCVTEFCTKLSNGVMIRVNVKIKDSDATENTAAVVKELSNYYGMKVYWDESKAKGLSEKYTKNPPTYKRVSDGLYIYEIPMKWKKDTSRSKYPLSIYAEDGTFNVAKPHLVVTYSTMQAKHSQVTDSLCRQMLQKMVPNGSVTMKKVTSPMENSVAYKGTVKNKNTTVTGYYVFCDYNVITFNIGSSKEPSKTQIEPLEHAFNSIIKY
ncbi:MAG: hypothetical protein ACOX1S_06420 [Anaerostipes sp.]|jgi:hypothetical protein